MDIMAVLTLSASLFFILNPFASLPVFLSITKGLDEKAVKSYANKAITVAAILLFVFMFIGPSLMSIFNVTMESFRVAGGVMLMLMAVEIVFGLRLSKVKDEKGAAWVIIATPILTGPGVITAAILFSSQYGILPVMAAGIISLAATWVILRFTPLIMRYVGEQAISIVSKIIGLLIAAMAVEYMLRGIVEWMRLYAADALSAAAVLL
ncbi:MAG: MarC family protein [Candidatus Methanomethylophilaceae archaeon]|jgi:multiple antibiotic resistance protein|nr:MarC family protein [Candidatus Methanomethylophilaceae archaeon]NLF33774.1 MarC family protein [Thermoplasmatales archaeon]